MAAAEAAAEVQDLLAQAEDHLQRGLLEQAQQTATSALQRTQDPAALGRGYAVLIQADFQQDRLTDLQGTLQQCGHQMQQLPLTSVMLWGVVAVEFQEADTARDTLGVYLEATHGRPAGMSREDAMALSRLYAVQLLAGLCQDFMAAARWLEAGGAGLSHEQQELLLLEVEEAEELLQEEHLAEWASTHAAAATDGGAADPAAAARAGAGPAGADADMYRDADVDAHSNAPCGTVCSTAASLSIADSAGGMLGFQSSPYADFPGSNVDENGGGSNSSSNDARQGLMNGLGPSASCSEPTSDQQQQQQQQREAGSSGIEELAAAMDAAATAVARAPASAAQQQPQQQELLPVDRQWQQAAAAEVAAAEVAAEPAAAAAAAAGAGDDNPFCTITGLVDALDETGSGETGSAAAAAACDAGAGAGSGAVSSTAVGAGAAVPQPRACALKSGASIDSASSSRARDQSSGGSCSSSKVAGGAAGDMTLSGGAAAGAAAGRGVATGSSGRQQQQGEQQQPPQQQQSLMEWISSSGSKLWSAPAVQGTLHALHLQDLQPYEVVGGAALAGLVGYSVYRERRAIKRAAADLAAGVFQTAQMALGFTVVNPMGAVPGTQHMLR